MSFQQSDETPGVVETLGIALFNTKRLRRLIDGIFDPPSAIDDILWTIFGVSKSLHLLQNALVSSQQLQQVEMVSLLQAPLDSCINTVEDVEQLIKPFIRPCERQSNESPSVERSAVWIDPAYKFDEYNVLSLRMLLTGSEESLDVATKIVNLSNTTTIDNGDILAVKQKLRALRQALDDGRASNAEGTYPGLETERSGKFHPLEQWVLRAETYLEEVICVVSRPACRSDSSELGLLKSERRPGSTKRNRADIFTTSSSRQRTWIAGESQDRPVRRKPLPALLAVENHSRGENDHSSESKNASYDETVALRIHAYDSEEDPFQAQNRQTTLGEEQSCLNELSVREAEPEGGYVTGFSQDISSPLYDAATGRGTDRIESKDIVALMDHLTVRDAQRSAKDTEILVTLVRSAAEMRNSFEDMKKFISEIPIYEEDPAAGQQSWPPPASARRYFRSPEVPNPDAENETPITQKRRNVFKRALRGLGSKNANDLGRIEQMLVDLLGEVEILQDSSRPDPHDVLTALPRIEEVPDLPRRNSTDTMSTMDVPAPPYCLSNQDLRAAMLTYI